VKNIVMNEQHLVHQLAKRASEQPERVALRIWRNEQWQETRWGSLEQLWGRVAKSLIHLGHQAGERVAIMSPNMPEWTIADLGILNAGGCVVPIYPTNTKDQTQYIVEDCQARIMFVGQNEQFAVGLELLEAGQIETLICFEGDVAARDGVYNWNSFLALSELVGELGLSELHQRRENLAMHDLVTLIYTSGTTGEPKGVMLDARNFAATFRMHDKRLDVDRDDVSLSFLPLSHIFERAWCYYVLYRGAINVYLSEPSQVQQAMARTQPTLMCSVPRLYEKIHTAIYHKVGTAPIYRRMIFRWAIAQAHAYFHVVQEKQQPGFWLETKQRFAERLVLAKLRKIFGQAKLLPCSGAALSDDINRFFQSIGVPITYGYGLTESTATVSCYVKGDTPVGSIGTPLDELEIRISEQGEILVKGDTVMRGYFNKPDATAETLVDGWLHTGDAGQLDATGHLRLTERIKELMKTSGGKYIAPQRVEGALIREPLFEQVAIIADARHFVSALIVPAFEALESHAQQMGLRWKDRAELLELIEIKQLVHERLQLVQSNLARFEQVKRFTLLPQEFCMKRGELTPTLKLRRKVIETRFAQQIQAMYGEKIPLKA
jgi:long-chain acyl-CoA synthetase